MHDDMHVKRESKQQKRHQSPNGSHNLLRTRMTPQNEILINSTTLRNRLLTSNSCIKAGFDVDDVVLIFSAVWFWFILLLLLITLLVLSKLCHAVGSVPS